MPINYETTVSIPMDDWQWSIKITNDPETDMIQIALHWDKKLNPTHVTEISAKEWDAMHKQLRKGS